MKRGQAAIEFMVFVGVAMLLLLVYVGISNHYLNVLYNEEKMTTADDFLQTMVNEFNVAGRVENGYFREITLPQKIGKYDYQIYIGDGINRLNQRGNKREIVVYSENREYVKLLSVDADDKCGKHDGKSACINEPGALCTWTGSNICITDLNPSNGIKGTIVIKKENNQINWYKPK